jgi:hypothetical protein
MKPMNIMNKAVSGKLNHHRKRGSLGLPLPIATERRTKSHAIVLN